jgi:hypothetical protein
MVMRTLLGIVARVTLDVVRRAEQQWHLLQCQLIPPTTFSSAANMACSKVELPAESTQFEVHMIYPPYTKWTSGIISTNTRHKRPE